MRFTDILFAVTLITGLIWLLDSLFWKPKRLLHIMPSSHKSAIKEPVVVEYAKAFFPILLIVLILRSFLAEPFRIPSGSMRPTLLEGDFILVNKYNYGLRLPVINTKIFELATPKRGDVIVFKHIKNGESMDMIKRVVGLPGDHVEYKDKVVYINGQPVKQEFQQEQLDRDPKSNFSWPVRHQLEFLGEIQHDIFVRPDEKDQSYRYSYADTVVPENSYFVMGDNRDNSDDSRVWGFVQDEDIIGRAMGIWMSWDTTAKGADCLQNCVRWNRIGKGLSLPFIAKHAEQHHQG